MYTALNKPVDVPHSFGTLKATHVAHSFSVDAVNNTVISSLQYGVEVDGQFQPFPGGNQVVQISGDDFKALTQNGEFTASAVRAKHAEVFERLRQQNVDAAQRAAAAQETAQQPANQLPPARTLSPVPGSPTAGPVIGG